MKDVNVAIMSGHVTTNPVLRETKNGKPFCLFNIASNNFIRRDDEWQKEPTFITVKCWNELAMKTYEKVHKGLPVMVYGHLKYVAYTGESEKKVAYNYISANQIEPIRKKDSQFDAATDENGTKNTAGSFATEIDEETIISVSDA